MPTAFYFSDEAKQCETRNNLCCETLGVVVGAMFPEVWNSTTAIPLVGTTNR